MQKIIELRNVWKTYQIGSQQINALKGLNFTALKGEFISIMGPSGSGKSTAMNLMGSLDVPTKGQVFLDNIDIATLSESDLATIRGKKIGFVFQQFNLIPTLTAKENVMLPMIFQGVSKDIRVKKAEEILNIVELKDRMNNKPTELSGGQQQRVAIARALANNPEVILADEPTGNLDTKTGEKVMEFLQQLNKEGKTIIMVTHEPELAEAYAQIVYWLRDGKVEKVTRKKNGFNIEKEEKELIKKHPNHKKVVKK